MSTVSASANNIDARENAPVHVGNNIYYSDNSCLRLLQTTNPKHDKARIEEDKGGLMGDVYKWVLHNDTFLRWRRGEGNSLLWIRGDPGKGKTMLLCGIVDELEKDGVALSYFFCQASDDRINSATAVLPNLIYMLVDRRPSLLWHVQKRYDNSGAQLFEGINAWFAVRDIFIDIVHDPELQRPYLIVDALDECQTDRSRLLDLVISTSRMLGVKWLVSSRNWPDIEQKLACAGQQLSLELNAEQISAAVRPYIQMKVSLLAAETGYDKKMEEDITSYLSSNARDTFLWVSLVCKSLGKVNRFKALKTLQSFPAGLNALYARMMQVICSMDDLHNVQLCLRILSVASVVYRPVTLEELGAIIENPFGHDQVARGQVDVSWLEHYVRLCGSFLVIRERAIYFVHQSAKDFTRDRSRNACFSQLFPQDIGVVI